MSAPHRFAFENHPKLESAERRELQPPDPLVELVASWEPAVVLDVGVGSGYYALPLAARLPAAHIIGLDVEPRMFPVLDERAQALGLPGAVQPLEAPPDRIPLENGTVHAAMMINLFHELDDRLGYLAEIRRVLAPGGHLLICDWDPAAAGEFGPPLDHRVPHDVATAQLADSGFSTITSHEVYRDLYVLTGLAP